MSLHEIQAKLWEVLLLLRQSDKITNREATSIALVRFTWTKDQALQKLNELTSELQTVTE